MKNKWLYIIACIQTVFLLSCGTESNELSAEERYAVDTIFSRQFNDWRKEEDSLCVVSSDTMYARMVDSLTADYMKEIEYLLKEHIIEE